MRRVLPILLVVVSAAALAEQFELNAPIPENARKVAEHRFRSPTDFEGTMKFYKTALPAKEYPRKNICNQPGVKALHIPNTSGKGGWEGLNIYEANEEVRIYVVPADGSAKKKGKKAPASSGK
ncbi:MAG: hypothetical protein AMXMBFR34_46540 [Myxococcaceae bacterium]